MVEIAGVGQRSDREIAPARHTHQILPSHPATSLGAHGTLPPLAKSVPAKLGVMDYSMHPSCQLHCSKILQLHDACQHLEASRTGEIRSHLGAPDQGRFPPSDGTRVANAPHHAKPISNIRPKTCQDNSTYTTRALAPTYEILGRFISRFHETRAMFVLGG